MINEYQSKGEKRKAQERRCASYEIEVCHARTYRQAEMKHDLTGVKNSDIIEAITEYCHSQRDRNILISRYVDGLTFGELADKYGLSEDGIYRILAKHECILLKVRKK